MSVGRDAQFHVAVLDVVLAEVIHGPHYHLLSDRGVNAVRAHYKIRCVRKPFVVVAPVEQQVIANTVIVSVQIL